MNIEEVINNIPDNAEDALEEFKYLSSSMRGRSVVKQDHIEGDLFLSLGNASFTVALLKGRDLFKFNCGELARQGKKLKSELLAVL